MMGCRFGAKNTLDLGYLYLAEKHGAKLFAETQVVNVKPLQAERRQRRIRGPHRKIHRLAPSPTPPFHLSWSGLRSLFVGNHGTAF